MVRPIRTGLLALIGAVAWLGLVAAPTTGAPMPSSDGLDRLGSCLSAGGEGRVLLLMDTSASLQQSDPEAARVRAAGHLVGQLDRFAASSGSRVDVAVAGFADRFGVTAPWTPLGRGTDQVLAKLRSYGDRKAGFETDYWTAIDGARRYLMAHSSDTDCRALVWFSDGMYDLDARTSASEQERYGTSKPYGPSVSLIDKETEQQLERAGYRDLCRPGGLADALRVDGITTLAVGLSAEASAGDFDLMNGVATGAPVSGSSCGKQDATGLGQFTLATEIGDLFFAFDLLADPANRPLTNQTRLCPGKPCPEGTHRFVADPSIAEVSILAGATVPGYRAELISPDGSRIAIVPGDPITRTGAGWRAHGSWVSDSVFTMRLVRKSGAGWTGDWGLVFVDPSSSRRGEARSNIRLISDVEPVWRRANDVHLVTGEKTRLSLGLQRRDGTALDPSALLGDTRVGVHLERQDGMIRDLAGGLSPRDLSAPVPVNLREVSSGPARLILTLSRNIGGRGRSAELRLPKTSVAYPVQVALPPAYPRVAPAVDFGSGDTTEGRSATIDVEGRGCVWLEGVKPQTLPEESTRLELRLRC